MAKSSCDVCGDADSVLRKPRKAKMNTSFPSMGVAVSQGRPANCLGAGRWSRFVLTGTNIYGHVYKYSFILEWFC